MGWPETYLRICYEESHDVKPMFSVQKHNYTPSTPLLSLSHSLRACLTTESFLSGHDMQLGMVAIPPIQLVGPELVSNKVLVGMVT